MSGASFGYSTVMLNLHFFARPNTTSASRPDLIALLPSTMVSEGIVYSTSNVWDSTGQLICIARQMGSLKRMGKSRIAKVAARL